MLQNFILNFKKLFQSIDTEINTKEILDGAVNYLLEGGDIENATILQTCSITEARITLGFIGKIAGFLSSSSIYTITLKAHSRIAYDVLTEGGIVTNWRRKKDIEQALVAAFPKRKPTLDIEVIGDMASARLETVARVSPQSKALIERVSPQLVRNNSQAAIEHAFTVFEDYLRKRLGLGADVYGENLINQAFGKHGKLTYGAVENEDKGVRDLMAGAYATFRNPRKHRIIEDDTYTALSILSLIDLIIRLIDEAKNK